MYFSPDRRSERRAHQRAGRSLECESEPLPVAGFDIHAISKRSTATRNTGVASPPVSAAAQTASVVDSSPAKPKKKSSGWNDLKTLFPYLRKYKGMTTVGLITLTLMGAVGALPQLIIGMITRLPAGLAANADHAARLRAPLLTPLFWLYAPLSRHALGNYCMVLMCVMFVKGFFSFWTRWILIGVSREIEYDLRNDMLERLVTIEPEFYVRNRTGDLMSRATNDLNAVRMVLGPGIMYSATTMATMVLAIYFMFKLSPSLTLWVLIPVPCGGIRGAVISARSFTVYPKRSRRRWECFPRARRRISPAFA